MKRRLFFFLTLLFLLCAPACRSPSAHGSIAPHRTELFNEAIAVPIPIPSEKGALLPVPALCQYPTLPTGCEATAAAMVLQFYGEEISPEAFAKDWLSCSEDFYSYFGKSYGPDPNKVFAGDPFSSNAYGCFAGPIADAVRRNSSACTAEILEGRTLEELCTDYIDEGMPLLIWATSSMRASEPGNSWYLDHKTPFTWIAGEHCLVLVGYDEQFYFLNDPASGSTVGYQKAVVEKRFAELGSRALLITPRAS